MLARPTEAQLIMKFSSSQQTLQSIAKTESSEEKILSPFHFLKGSVRYDELPEIPVLTQISICNVEEFSEKCRLLPCIKESCFLSDEHYGFRNTFETLLWFRLCMYFASSQIYLYSSI